jgi:hypothetical protein
VILRERDARLPHHAARQGVERLQPPVDHGHVEQPLIQRQAAVHDAAADLRAHVRLVDPRIPAPLLLAGLGVDANTTLQFVMP